MRLMFVTLGIATLAALSGCARSQQKAQSSDEVVQSMRAELSQTIDKGDSLAFEAMNDELSHTVGTTTLTNAEIISPALPPMPLPESRMSLSTPAPTEEAPAPAMVAMAADGAPMFLEASDAILPTQTWGTATQLDLTEIPDTRE